MGSEVAELTRYAEWHATEKLIAILPDCPLDDPIYEIHPGKVQRDPNNKNKQPGRKPPRNNNNGACRDNQDGNRGSGNGGGSGGGSSGGAGMAGGGDPNGGGGGALPPETLTETSIPEGQGGGVDQTSTPLTRWFNDLNEREKVFLGMGYKPGTFNGGK